MKEYDVEVSAKDPEKPWKKKKEKVSIEDGEFALIQAINKLTDAVKELKHGR